MHTIGETVDVDELAPLKTIQGLSNGHFVEDLHLALVLVAEEVVLSRKKGAVSVTFNIHPNSDDTILITDDLQRKPPKRESRSSVFFSIGDGLLHKGDPRQTQMELRQVDGKTELRAVDAPVATRKEVG